MGQADLSVSAELTGEQQVTSAVEQINKAVVEFSTSGKSAEASAAAFTAGLRGMAEAESGLHISLQNSITALRAQKSVLSDPAGQAAIREAAILRQQVESATTAILANTAGTRENAAAIKAAAEAEAAQKRSIEAAAKALADKNQAALDAAAREAALIPSVRGVTDALGQQTAALRAQRDAMRTPEYQQYAAQQKAIKAEIEAMQASQQGFLQRMGGMATAVQAFLALQAVGYLKDMTMAVFDATAEMQSLKMGMNAVMKSSSLAAEEMAKLKEVAKLPGLGYAEAIRMSTGLQAAGFSADQARKSMGAFGNALAIVGKGKADLDGVGLALTQIMSKGKVSAEEINQIAERVPQIRIAMQDAFGTANTELIQKMGLTSGQFIRGVTDELGKLEKVTDGLKNGAGNLSDAWFQFKANVGGSGSVFQSTLDILAKGLEKANGLMEEAEKRNQRTRINNAMGSIAANKDALEKMGANAKGIYANSLREGLEESRKYLASIAKENAKADEEKKKKAAELTDGQKDLQRQASHLAKASLAEDIKAEEMANKLRIKDAAGRDESLQQAAKIHEARLAEIKSEWAKKAKKPTEKTDTKYGADQESARLIEQALKDESAVEKIREQTQIMNLKAAKDGIEDVAQLREIDREVEAMQLHAKYVDEQNAARGSKEKLKAIQDQYRAALRVLNAQWDAKDAADDAKEAKAYAKRLEERAKVEREANAKSFNDRTKEGVTAYKSEVSLWQSRLGIYNSSLSGMLSGDKSYHAAAREMWETTKNTAITSILELGEKWIAEKIAMATFSDAMRAEEVAANGTQAAIIAAQDATPAALASTMSFGSAAVIGGAALAAAVAMAASFDVGTPSVQGDQFAKIHNRETILPTWASIPAQRGDWGPAQRFMGQTGGGSSTSTSTSSQTNHITIHVAGTKASAEDIAKAVVRAQKIQGRTRAGTSF